jgi:hypothetical protein
MAHTKIMRRDYVFLATVFEVLSWRRDR